MKERDYDYVHRVLSLNKLESVSQYNVKTLYLKFNNYSFLLVIYINEQNNNK